MLQSNQGSAQAKLLAAAIADLSATIGVIGLGYVGLPLAATVAQAGFKTIGFDIDEEKVKLLNGGTSYVDAVPASRLAEIMRAKRFRASGQFEDLLACDVIFICVPTPLTRNRDPDLSFVTATARLIGRHIRSPQLVVLASTTFPGTTTEIVKPILEETGLKSGLDFFLGYSPEREDPGNTQYQTATIPRVIAGDGADAQHLVNDFFRLVVRTTVPVSSPATAEAVKITENVFRAVNIALVNELKVIYDAMGVDVWEVIDAAATKPFGYMPFYPGPGLGGHCIPIDPFYLAWKSKEYEQPTRFIELAGEINLSMPRYVIDRMDAELDRRLSIPPSKARVLIIGIAYKKNVGDVRESPSLKLIKLLEQRGGQVEFHDPHVAVIPPTREHPELTGRKSVVLTAATLQATDCALLVTDHDAVDYRMVAAHARLVIDTRNTFGRKGISGNHIVKA
jgi:UDP-N-acetyl-D-glucosamine dehydrogenase